MLDLGCVKGQFPAIYSILSHMTNLFKEIYTMSQKQNGTISIIGEFVILSTAEFFVLVLKVNFP